MGKKKGKGKKTNGASNEAASNSQDNSTQPGPSTTRTPATQSATVSTPAAATNVPVQAPQINVQPAPVVSSRNEPQNAPAEKTQEQEAALQSQQTSLEGKASNGRKKRRGKGKGEPASKDQPVSKTESGSSVSHVHPEATEAAPPSGQEKFVSVAQGSQQSLLKSSSKQSSTPATSKESLPSKSSKQTSPKAGKQTASKDGPPPKSGQRATPKDDRQATIKSDQTMSSTTHSLQSKSTQSSKQKSAQLGQQQQTATSAHSSGDQPPKQLQLEAVQPIPSKVQQFKQPAPVEPPKGAGDHGQESPSSSSGNSICSQGDVVPKSYGMELPIRKKRYEGGELGRKIQIRTNFMPLNLKNICKTAIHYDITFDPDKPKRFLKIVFNKFCLDHFQNRYPAFDGVKNVYASSPLPKVGVNLFQGEVSIINPDNELEKKYKVTIKFASYVDMTSLSKYMANGSSIETPQEALQCIDILFRHALSNRFVQVGKSFFTPPSGRIVSLGDGMDLWYGLFSSCVLGWKPYLNVDVAHKGFPTKQLVSDYMKFEKNIDLAKPISAYALEEVRKFVKSLKVIYQIPNKPTTKRCFRINDIRNIPADEETFEDDKKKKITVVKYYKESKGYNVLYPKAPCLWVGSRNKNIYVPPELCTIHEGQIVLKKLTENQTRNMIKCAATPTELREKKIMDAYNNSRIENHPAVKEFNLSIDSRFEKVDARVLDPPKLEYAGGNVVTPREGVWRAEREKFLKAVTIQNWTVLNLDFRTRIDAIDFFCKEMIKYAVQLGITINAAKPAVTLDSRRLAHDLPEFFRKAKYDKMDLVFVVISQDETYSKVKQTAELQFGVLTQCIKGSTLNKLSPSTCHNILLKVNAKLNGTNYQFSSRVARRPLIFNRPVMIVGADVTHPSPDQTDIPSVVGVAASHDPNAFKYNMIWRLQLPKIEIIEDLQSIMRDHLLKFYKDTRQKPQGIYFFRDGVSEGQFKQVLNSEFTAIRRACQSLEINYKPPITMLVVQKRHHTRFFPSEADAVGRNRNVPPGTVVDKSITHPTERDFYLVSHQSIQGVARPTKYKVLWDDNNLTEDQLQELTYFLCHMFSRCTRAVSYPTPTYYAHLAAYRGRIYIEGKKIQLNNLQREQESRKIQEDVQKNKPMFFV
uniref:Putative germ-line stem cell division protein hiwi/piwi n=1 Tax=Xenopsylla cheopis TaxID=163159 RepID=A0A6M2DIC2_XENCH